ncbi:MAG TPA: hypothetical protein VFZ09_26920 [Archangium sp.]|uniref:hypothetical protein n=1 Tax=Archangium sp. TaxID=1872627 RepID=UPI002E37F218|nr:hypothetical protein [Archangium sp.]HEX5749893.1 hypothetical protein [Archangium sp.]
MNGRVAMLTLSPLLLISTVGCPHAWSREGTIDKALERDMIEYYSMKDCALDKQEWEDACATFYERASNPAAQQLCPPECRPTPPPGTP